MEDSKHYEEFIMARAVRHQDEYMTRLTEKRFDEERNKATSLCEGCARYPDTCQTGRKVKESFSQDALHLIGVYACAEFEAKLIFASPTGFSGHYNTLRLGDASGKFKVGQVVALCDKQENVVQRARITDVIVGRKEMILAEHSARNHSMKDDKGSPAHLAELLTKRMGRHYHSYQWKREPNMTAIYFRNIK